ncbi:MAG: YfhO family protein [Planctomycetota bacterium]
MEASQRERAWLFVAAASFYICIALFFFREAVFTDRVQLCTDITQTTFPWALDRSDDFQPRNPALSDQCTVFYPWFHYTAEMLRQGSIPLWTPHALGGAPYMGNLSTAIFYPLNLLIAVMPVPTFFLVQSLFKLVAAGLFMYLFLRSVGLKFFFALFGGMVYSLCGYSVLWVISHLTSVSIFMPALFWATEIYLKRRSGGSLALITALLSLQFLGAQPETSLCMVTAWAIYTLFRIRNGSGLFTRAGVVQVLYLVPAGLLSVGLVLFQLWPFMEYMVRSFGLYIREQGARASTLYGGGDPIFSAQGLGAGFLLIVAVVVCFWLFRKGKKPASAILAGMFAGLAILAGIKAGLMTGLKPHLLIQVFPDLYGNALQGVRTAGGAAYPEFNGGYASVIGFMLAMIGWIACWKRSPVRILGALFLLSFGTVHGIPFITQWVRFLPAFELTQPGRIICVSAFAVSALCAFGLDFLVRRVAAPGAGMMAGLRMAGFLLVAGSAVSLWGWGFLEPGMLPGGADGVAESREGGVDEGRVHLSSPRPGQAFEAVKGIWIEGFAEAGVTNISFFLNGLSVASMPLDGTKAQPIDQTLSMERFEEGTYRLCMSYLSGPDGEERIHIIPVTLIHSKSISQKDLIVFIVSCAILILLFIVALPIPVRCGLALAMALVDLSLFGASYNCTSKADSIFPDTPVTDYLSAQEGVFRILPENVILQPSTNYVYGYQILRGYDGLELPEYNQLLDVLKKDPWVDIHHYNSKTLDYENPILDLLGVKYIVSLDDLTGIPGLVMVQDGFVKIYQNLEALPRAFVVSHWINTDQLSQQLQEDLSTAFNYLKEALTIQSFDFEKEASSLDRFIQFVARHFNFREWAFLEEEVDCKGGGTGQVEMEIYTNDYISLNVEMKGEGLLIFTENYYPGWIALIDGKEERILRADITFKAIPLTDGKHRVELIYSPISYYGGLKVALASLILLALFCFVPFFCAPLKKTCTQDPAP